MQTVTTIGLDIAKSVFQVHGVDAAGQVVIRRQLKRRYVLGFFRKPARSASKPEPPLFARTASQSIVCRCSRRSDSDLCSHPQSATIAVR